MNEQQALLNSIAEQPEEDGLRLIYADWLEEHGQPERAEFIRLQIQLAGLADDDPRRAALEKRERILLRMHRKEWYREIRPKTPNWPFSRGFVVPHLDLTVANFVRRDHADLACCPLWTAELRGRTSDIAELADSPHLRRLASLQLWPTWAYNPAPQLHPAAVTYLCRSPHTVNLRRLKLYTAQIGDEGVTELAHAPLLARLKELDLSFTRVGDEGVRALTDEGVRALAESPLAAGLQSLILRNNPRITDAGVVALAASPHMAGLTVLDLALNDLGLRAARAIADSPYLKRIRRLLLTPRGARAAELLRKHFGARVIL